MAAVACSVTPTLQTTSSPVPVTPSPGARVTVTATAITPLSAQRSLKVAQAFAKTRAVRQVRYEIASQVALTQQDKIVQQPGLNARGAESGENRQLALSGIMNATGQPTTFEFITLNGVTYIKGLNGIPGVNPAQWYRFPQELGNVTHDAPGVKSLLAQLETHAIEQANFQSVGQETLDGQTCVIWLARDPNLAQGLLGIAGGAQAGSQMQALDDSEFRVWTCADGYIHRFAGVVRGHDPANPAHQSTAQLAIHLYDHDAEIVITAPSDAQDFQAPAADPGAPAAP